MEPIRYISDKCPKSKKIVFKGITISKDITGRITTIKKGEEKYTIVKLGGR